MIEKYGGLWDVAPDDSWLLVYDQYQAATDRLAAVFLKEGLFKALTFEKVSDPQWGLPWWSPQRPEAMFDVSGDAISYVERLTVTAE